MHIPKKYIRELARRGGMARSERKTTANRAKIRAFWASPEGAARREAMRKKEPENAHILEALESGGHAQGI